MKKYLSLFLIASACGGYESDISADHWRSIHPPVNAPNGTQCWLWKDADGSNGQYGGPVCYFPNRTNSY